MPVWVEGVGGFLEHALDGKMGVYLPGVDGPALFRDVFYYLKEGVQHGEYVAFGDGAAFLRHPFDDDFVVVAFHVLGLRGVVVEPFGKEVFV